jgi:hypothetical protein
VNNKALTERNKDFFDKLGKLLKEYSVEISSFGEGQGSEGSTLCFYGDGVEIELQNERYEGFLDYQKCCEITTYKATQ